MQPTLVGLVQEISLALRMASEDAQACRMSMAENLAENAIQKIKLFRAMAAEQVAALPKEEAK